MRRFLAVLLTIACSMTLSAQQAPTPTPQPMPARGGGQSSTPTPLARGGLMPAQPQVPQPPQPPNGPKPAVPNPTPVLGTMQNIHIELAIQDSVNSDVQAKRSAAVTVVDRESGQVRSSSGYDHAMLNVDVSPSVLQDGRILLSLRVEYQAINPGSGSDVTPPLPLVTESLTIILVDGKPTVVSQSADARSSRQVTVTVTASILK